MNKKDFKGGLDSVLQSTVPDQEQKPQPKKTGRPKKSSQEGTREGETRATFIVKEELLEKLKAVAYWERVMIKDIVNNALQEYVDAYRKKHKEIKHRPVK